ncbi:MAG: hypothetical protein H7232_10900 [Aeromicrobium sp.]|nr:hypothetical protein [Burkholderiales bacterium]
MSHSANVDMQNPSPALRLVAPFLKEALSRRSTAGGGFSTRVIAATPT